MKHKILLRKEQKQYVPELDKEVKTEREVQFYIEQPYKDFHTKYGVIKAKDLKKKPGSAVKTSMGKKFIIIDADFIDDLRRIRRLPQTMSAKDMGIIVSATGVNKGSFAIDAGTGSGALACYLAHICKKVVSYEILDKHIEVAKQNQKFLGLKNLTIKKGSIYEKIPEKNADLLVLDVPEPWKAIKTAENALRIGGYLVVYAIQATQMLNFTNELLKNKRFLLIKNCELIERTWKAEGQILRPSTAPFGHTGFLVFARKIC
ncbi:MAG: methyltransferase domain-containing protein [Candidatus Woesearchaeota archaeon]